MSRWIFLVLASVPFLAACENMSGGPVRDTAAGADVGEAIGEPTDGAENEIEAE